MKKQFISQLKEGDSVSDAFAVKFRKPPRRYADGKRGAWFSMQVSDKTGEVPLRFWGDDEEKTWMLYDIINAGDVLMISGFVRMYNNKAEISVNSYDAIKKISDFDIKDFVEISPHIEENREKLAAIIDSVQDADINQLLHVIFSDELMKKYCAAPAAMHLHQNYIGGLLEHVLNVFSIAERIGDVHKLDRDLLVAGSLLHDIGKIWEFDVTTSIDISEEGMLIGHITIGHDFVKRKIEEIEDFSETTKLKILHMILSHQGKNEWGSPKTPQFPEAYALFFSDEADAKLTQIRKLKAEAQTEDSWIWTKHFGHIYLK